MKYMIIGDVHLADRPPSVRRESYRDDILNKLEWIINRANEEDVNAVLQLGDLFHVKSPSRNSHYLVQATADIFGNSKSPVRIVAGNHDLVMDRVEDINKQPLGSVSLHPNVTLVNGLDPDFPIYGIPYFDLSGQALDYWASKYHAEAGPDVAPTIITHNSLFPEAQSPIYNYVSYESWAAAFQNPYTLYGHIHTQVVGGPHFKVGSSWFVNEGSISRGSLHESSLTRKPTVAIFDSDKDTPFTSIPIPYRPASEVFNLEVVEVLKNRQTTVDTFLESLGSSDLQYLTIEGILDNARQTSTLPKEAVVELEDIIQNIALSD